MAKRLTPDDAPQQFALCVVRLDVHQKSRYRFYADGLTVLETADRHGVGWHPWRIEFSEMLDNPSQVEALEGAVADGYAEEVVR